MEDEVKKKLDEVQNILVSLQDTGASFMFLSKEGGNFVLCGNPDSIIGEILFAMMRYPVIRQIIKLCAMSFGVANRKYGDEARNAPLGDLIERDPENEGN